MTTPMTYALKSTQKANETAAAVLDMQVRDYKSLFSMGKKEPTGLISSERLDSIFNQLVSDINARFTISINKDVAKGLKDLVVRSSRFTKDIEMLLKLRKNFSKNLVKESDGYYMNLKAAMFHIGAVASQLYEIEKRYSK